MSSDSVVWSVTHFFGQDDVQCIFIMQNLRKISWDAHLPVNVLKCTWVPVCNLIAIVYLCTVGGDFVNQDGTGGMNYVPCKSISNVYRMSGRVVSYFTIIFKFRVILAEKIKVKVYVNEDSSISEI
jgi:hypothetical protein